MVAVLWLVFASALPLTAQQSGIDQNLELLRPPGEPPYIRWQAKLGRTYFIQVSTQAEPLQKWTFAPFIEVGEGQTISYEVPASAERGFFRLKYTDIPILPGELPEHANPDGDGLTSEEELLITGTDPLEYDTDGDGLSDGWEDRNGLDPNDPFGDNGSDGDPDHDGLLNSEERDLQTKPNDADSDTDGITDGSEVNQGTLPNDPNSKPAAEWFVLTGDYPEVLTKTRSRTITIPKGECRLVAVMLASDEFPDFTGNESEYNDLLYWNVVGGGLGLDVLIDVNSRHDEWLVAQAAGISHLGFEVVHLEDYHPVQAPTDADLTMNISLSATNIGDEYRWSTVMVGVLPFKVEIASIRDGQFSIIVPELSLGELGTLDLIVRQQGSDTGDVILCTWENQAPGRITISLDEIMNQDPSTLDGQDTHRFDRVKARWRCGTMDITSGDKNLDTHAVEVLARRRVSNYFSPTWGGTWGGNSLQKGVYPAGQFPAGLHNVARQTGFLNALDPLNEGLAMDGNTVIRDQVQPAQQGFNRVLYLNGAEQGYIESPDRLSYDDEVYIPQFSVRTVDDSGTLDGNTDQIDVWRGQGDQTLQDTVDNFGLRRRTCLKIIPAPES